MRIIGTFAVALALLSATAAAAAPRGGGGSSSPGKRAQLQEQAFMSLANATMTTRALPAAQLARARLATAKYANDLAAARADGYAILTKLIPGMGYHFINPSIKGFDVRRPPILVYEHHGARWQLGALEWVFPSKPASPPLAGAKYGSFPAACHYDDGTFTPEPSAGDCAPASPQTGSKFNFWHPRLVTMHVWIWYPNPAGMYASMNPLVPSFS